MILHFAGFLEYSHAFLFIRCYIYKLATYIQLIIFPDPTKRKIDATKAAFLFSLSSPVLFSFSPPPPSPSLSIYLSTPPLSLFQMAQVYMTWHGMHAVCYLSCGGIVLMWNKKVPKKLRTYLRVCTTTRSIFQMKKRENIHMFLFLTKEYGQQRTTKMKQFVSYFF